MTHAQAVEDARALLERLEELAEDAPLMSWKRAGYVAVYHMMEAVAETLDEMADAEAHEEADE